MATLMEMERETPAKAPASMGLMLESATPNGYRLRYRSGAGICGTGETIYQFEVLHSLSSVTCGVRLPAYVKELVRAETGREHLPAGGRFWEAMCEEALSNYLFRNDRLPDDDTLRVVDLTPDLLRWVNAVIEALS